NIDIRPQTSARYLGIIFDKQLRWQEHVKHIETRIQSRINLLRFLNRITPDSNEKIMLNIYKSLIRPILTYGSSVLLHAEDKIWNRLQIAQNKSIRAALNIPHFVSTTYIHQITNIPYIRSYVTNLTERALTRSQQLEDTDKSEVEKTISDNMDDENSIQLNETHDKDLSENEEIQDQLNKNDDKDLSESEEIPNQLKENDYMIIENDLKENNNEANRDDLKEEGIEKYIQEITTNQHDIRKTIFLNNVYIFTHLATTNRKNMLGY
ncbi:unnamed protein product, partial [Adineta steineri]